METDRLSVSVEEACLNAWPALKEIFYDGWLIRLAEGETRRINSVNVIGRGAYAVGDKIAYCESVYRAHGLPAYFRLRSNDDSGLDAVLATRGYRAEDETRTLYMDFARTPPKPAPGAFRVAVTPDAPGEDWFAAHERFSERMAANDDIRRRLLALVALPVAFAAAHDGEGRVISVAYGAVHDRLVLLQWVATDPVRRREGLSRATLGGLLSWAREAGARGACLQVVATNAPAVVLYEQLGFDRELYRYHYRVQ